MGKQTQQPIPKPCPECGGEHTFVQVATNQGHILIVAQPKRRAGFFSNISNQSHLVAFACTTCGYTTLYATEPRNLITDQERG